jgi:hypothetical protein
MRRIVVALLGALAIAAVGAGTASASTCSAPEPNICGTDFDAAPGVSWTGVIAQVYDFSGCAYAQVIHVDWGDGTAVQNFTYGDGTSCHILRNVVRTHTYASVGNYTTNMAITYTGQGCPSQCVYVAQGTVRVRVPTTLIAEDAPWANELRATLTRTSNGHPLTAGRTIKFTAPDSSVPGGIRTLCAAQTDATGLATCDGSAQLHMIAGTPPPYTATYAGSSIYATSSDTAATLK